MTLLGLLNVFASVTFACTAASSCATGAAGLIALYEVLSMGLAVPVGRFE